MEQSARQDLTLGTHWIDLPGQSEQPFHVERSPRYKKLIFLLNIANELKLYELLSFRRHRHALCAH